MKTGVWDDNMHTVYTAVLYSFSCTADARARLVPHKTEKVIQASCAPILHRPGLRIRQEAPRRPKHDRGIAQDPMLLAQLSLQAAAAHEVLVLSGTSPHDGTRNAGPRWLLALLAL